jgi:hypothetical protein
VFAAWTPTADSADLRPPDRRAHGVVLGVARPREGGRCCTSPTSTFPSEPTRSSSRARRCGPSTTATPRWNSGRSATRPTLRRSTMPTRRSAGPTATRRRSRSTSSGMRPARRRRSSRRATGSRPTRGYEQVGVVHGAVEVLGEPRLELAEIPAHRWHRWTTESTGFGPLALPEVRAHAGVRSPFAFPDGSVSDLVLTPRGWARRVARPA